MNKEPFCFSYTTPTLDWYETIHVEIRWEDYLYFKIQYRFGGGYWLLGYQEKDGRFERREVELGRIAKYDIGKFAKWCEIPQSNSVGSKLIGISVISTGMNIMERIAEILEVAK